MMRSGRPEDLDALVRIEEASQATGWTRAQLEEELTRDQSIVLVTEDSGVIQGFSVGWCVAGEVHVLNVAVDPGHRRRGLGRALVEALLRQAGPGDALLELRASNTPALRLYESMGFTIEGRRRRYYKDGEDALLMTLPAAKVVLPGKS